MSVKKSKVSVILIVYNEENRLADCLRAITRQTLKAKEIIVVDNNSTDQSIAIARSFKGVSVIKETKQGMIHARNAGFNKATGEILARIDADVIVPSDWIQNIQTYFEHFPQIGGLTGYGQTRVGVTYPPISKAWSYFYFTFCKAYFGSNILWGANMAISRQAWQDIKDLVYDGELAREVHEDQDLSLSMIATGNSMAILPTLKVTIDFGDCQYFEKFYRYYKMMLLTKKIHKAHIRSKSTKIKLLPIQKRAYFGVISIPVLGAYFAFTAVHSAARIIIQSPITRPVSWVYKKLY